MAGKRYKKLIEMYEKSKLYSAQEAVELVKKMTTAKFDETVEISLKMNLKKGQSLRDTMVLPYQTSADKRILVFARGEKAEEAVRSGATYVGDDEYIEKVRNGWLDFDVVIATPDMMKDVGRLGPVLGRKGLMPNPKTKTVTTNIAAAIKELQKGRIEIRADKTGVVHIVVGKVSMSSEFLSENVQSIMNEVKSKKPADTKGDFIVSVAVSSTMGPGVRIAQSDK